MGGVYPASDSAMALNQLCSYLWFAGLVYVFAGKFICKAIGISEHHPAVKFVDDHRTYIIGGLFLLNTYSAQLLSSGAFEVYLDDELVYSKLLTGQVPSADEIMKILHSRGLF